MHTTTKADRHWRAIRRILPIKIAVLQKDGTIRVQRVEASVKKNKPSRAYRKARS